MHEKSAEFQAGAGTNHTAERRLRASLETLEDVVKFIGSMKPWRQTRPYWDRCASEVLKAAITGKHADIVEATRRLEIALRRDNWL